MQHNDEAAEMDATDRHLQVWDAMFTAPDGRDRETEGALHRAVRIHQASDRRLKVVLQDDPMSHDEYMTLHVLVGGQTKGRPRSTPAQLADLAGVSRAGMTGRLDKLERSGLVTRTPDSDDRRSVIVEITPAGRAAWERVAHRWSSEEGTLFDGLSTEELRTLNALLRKAFVALERTDRI
ncbi:MarR family winged helix-turn-helix transcriptional regulator [Calidifontibacter indicus]|uniref:MarR family winged helix-turn-helix transcriptional regulator n=1 Tax=Calidifontibacter indicus TaxID=419650 RepID=UPI0011C02E21|nr:MarR family transcriptional regulator [Calidifontibacter indicus]